MGPIEELVLRAWGWGLRIDAADHRPEEHSAALLGIIQEAGRLERAAKDAEKRGFIQGVGHAVAEIVRSHNERGAAYDVMRATGLSVDEFRRAGTSDYDLKSILKAT